MNCAAKDFIYNLLTQQNLYLLGALLLLLTILSLFRRRQTRSIVAYKTENGDVTISRAAIVELVHTTFQQINQVNKPRLKIFSRNGLTNFTVRLQLTSGSSLKEVEETLQNHLRESLSKNLGIENLGNINIVVTSFKSSRIRSTSNTPAFHSSSVQTEDKPEEYPEYKSEEDSEAPESSDESEKK